MEHVYDTPGVYTGGAESTVDGESIEGVRDDVRDFGVDGVLVPEIVWVVSVVFGLGGPIEMAANNTAVAVAAETGVTEAV